MQILESHPRLNESETLEGTQQSVVHQAFPVILMYARCENHLVRRSNVDFPGGSVVKNPPANAGDMGLSPGLGRFHMLQSN